MSARSPPGSSTGATGAGRSHRSPVLGGATHRESTRDRRETGRGPSPGRRKTGRKGAKDSARSPDASSDGSPTTGRSEGSNFGQTVRTMITSSRFSKLTRVFEQFESKTKGDEERPLRELLELEEMSMVDARRLMEGYRMQGNWTRHVSKQQKRWEKIAEKEGDEVAMRAERAERAEDAKIAARLAAAPEGDGVVTRGPDGRPISVCTWRTVLSDGTAFQCNNRRIRDPTDGRMLPTCGFHRSRCLDDHPGVSPEIKLPNELGVCQMHFVARTGKPPRKYKNVADVPGVEIVAKRSSVHPQRPRWDRDEEGVKGEEDEDEEDEEEKALLKELREAEGDVFDKINLQYRRWKLARGRPDPDVLQGIERIQATYKMRAIRRVYLVMLRLDDYNKRVQAAVYLQRLYRAKREGEIARAELRARKVCTLIIQRNWRNIIFLRKVDFERKRNVSVRRIQQWWIRRRLMFSFRVMRVRLRARIDGIKMARARVTLTRLMLGWIARWRVRRRRLEGFRRQMAAGRIQWLWKEWQIYKENRKLLEAAREVKHMHLAAKRIQQGWEEHRRRGVAKRWIRRQIDYIVRCQAYARRFFARREATRRREAKQAAFRWLQSSHSREELAQLLGVPDYLAMFDASRFESKPAAVEVLEDRFEGGRNFDGGDGMVEVEDALEGGRQRPHTTPAAPAKVSVLTGKDERRIVARLIEGTFRRPDGGDPSNTGWVKPHTFHRVIMAFGVPRSDALAMATFYLDRKTDLVSWRKFAESYATGHVPVRIGRLIHEEAMVKGHFTRAVTAMRSGGGKMLEESPPRGIVLPSAGFAKKEKLEASVVAATVDDSGKVPDTTAYVEMEGVRGRVVVVDPVVMDADRPATQMTLRDLKTQSHVMQAFLSLTSNASSILRKESAQDLDRERRGLPSRSDIESRRRVRRLSKKLFDTSDSSSAVSSALYSSALEAASNGTRMTPGAGFLAPQVKPGHKDALQTALDNAHNLQAIQAKAKSDSEAIQGAALSGVYVRNQTIVAPPITPIDPHTGRLQLDQLRKDSEGPIGADGKKHRSRKPRGPPRFVPKQLGDNPIPERTAVTSGPVLHVSAKGTLRPVRSLSALYASILVKLAKRGPKDVVMTDDTGRFTKLVVDNLAVFEMYWIRMVRDLRHGTLSDVFKVDDAVRARVEHALGGEQPARADRLEDLLRSLGFHGRETLRRSIALSEMNGDIEAASRIPHRPALVPRPKTLQQSLQESQSLYEAPVTSDQVSPYNPGRARKTDYDDVVAKRGPALARLLDRSSKGPAQAVRHARGGAELRVDGVDGALRGAVSIEVDEEPRNEDDDAEEEEEERTTQKDDEDDTGLVLYTSHTVRRTGAKEKSEDAMLAKRAAELEAAGDSEGARAIRETLRHAKGGAALAAFRSLPPIPHRAPSMSGTSMVVPRKSSAATASVDESYEEHEHAESARAPTPSSMESDNVFGRPRASDLLPPELREGDGGERLKSTMLDGKLVATSLLFHPQEDVFPHTAVAWIGRACPCPPNKPPGKVRLPGCPKHQWLYPSDTCPSCRNYRSLPLPQPPVTFYASLRLARSEPDPLNVHLLTTTLDPKLQKLGGRRHCAALVREDNGTVNALAVHAACADRSGAIWLIGFRIWFQHELAAVQPKYRANIMQANQVVRGRFLLHMRVTDTNIVGQGLVVRASTISEFTKLTRKSGLPPNNCFYYNEIVAQKTEQHLLELANLSSS